MPLVRAQLSRPMWEIAQLVERSKNKQRVLKKYGAVAQLVERRPCKAKAEGS